MTRESAACRERCSGARNRTALPCCTSMAPTSATSERLAGPPGRCFWTATGYLPSDVSMLGLSDDIHACLFDLDGVLTQTAKVHAAAWKQTFDDYLRARAAKSGESFEPFDLVADYERY